MREGCVRDERGVRGVRGVRGCEEVVREGVWSEGGVGV